MDLKTFVFITTIFTLYLVGGGFLFEFLERLDAYSEIRVTSVEAGLQKDNEPVEFYQHLIENNHITPFLVNIFSTLADNGYDMVESFNATGDFHNKTSKDSISVEATDLVKHRKWNTHLGIHYAVTVVTTVGYGRISPGTLLCKMITILYSVSCMRV